MIILAAISLIKEDLKLDGNQENNDLSKSLYYISQVDFHCLRSLEVGKNHTYKVRLVGSD